MFEEERDNTVVAGMDDFSASPIGQRVFDRLTRHLSDHFVYDEAAAADTVKEPAAALRPEALASCLRSCVGN